MAVEKVLSESVQPALQRAFDAPVRLDQGFPCSLVLFAGQEQGSLPEIGLDRADLGR